MDPNMTLAILIQALEDGKTEKAKFHFDDLVKWLETGGFRPTLQETLAQR